MAPLPFARRAREGSAGCAGPCSVCGVRSEGRTPRCCADLVGLPMYCSDAGVACLLQQRSERVYWTLQGIDGRDADARMERVVHASRAAV